MTFRKQCLQKWSFVFDSASNIGFIYILLC